MTREYNPYLYRGEPTSWRSVWAVKQITEVALEIAELYDKEYRHDVAELVIDAKQAKALYLVLQGLHAKLTDALKDAGPTSRLRAYARAAYEIDQQARNQRNELIERAKHLVTKEAGLL